MYEYVCAFMNLLKLSYKTTHLQICFYFREGFHLLPCLLDYQQDLS